MQTTTKIMNTHRDKELLDLSLEQLSFLYKQTKYDCIIAESFEKLKRLIVSVNKHYPHFEIDDSVSFALEKLTQCLLTYNPEHGGKFTTYFMTVYKNELRYETKQRNTHKRCIMYNTTSLNYLMEEGFDIGTDPYISSCIISLPKNLTRNEKLYCELILKNYGSNREIAEYMKVSAMTLTNVRKSLRVKLKNYFIN